MIIDINSNKIKNNKRLSKLFVNANFSNLSINCNNTSILNNASWSNVQGARSMHLARVARVRVRCPRARCMMWRCRVVRRVRVSLVAGTVTLIKCSVTDT